MTYGVDRHASQYESERKFLVTDQSVLHGSVGDLIVQGYLWARGGYAIRVRRRNYADAGGVDHCTPGMLTLKGPRQTAVRLEIETSIPNEDVDALLELCDLKIIKERHSIVSEGNVWDVDVFRDENEGLVIAEFEGSPREVSQIRKPWWCGVEVTEDDRYQNENLAANPFCDW